VPGAAPGRDFLFRDERPLFALVPGQD
jgi:hypothetical protein